jgi:hypothetical protein
MSEPQSLIDDGWAEVERMAQATTAADAQIANEYPQLDTIARWKRLFGYNHVEAVHLISEQRNDLARERITDELWAVIQDEKEAAGYDREAYEHSLQIPRIYKDRSAVIQTTGPDGGMVWLFRLGGLLDTPEKVQEIAGLDKVPRVVTGIGETSLAKFCYVDKEAQKKLEEWLTQQSVLQK